MYTHANERRFVCGTTIGYHLCNYAAVFVTMIITTTFHINQKYHCLGATAANFNSATQTVHKSRSRSQKKTPTRQCSQ
jgi:hypothetical protein